jgi:hypothetical protein
LAAGECCAIRPMSFTRGFSALDDLHAFSRA